MRKHWTDHFLEQAQLIAGMSTCASGRKVGCIMVRDNRVLTSGFNAVPSKVPHPETCARRDAGAKSGELLHLCSCIHAEANAIATAARHGVSLKGSTCYSTTAPCVQCIGQMINSGIVRVVYLEEYAGATAEMAKSIAKWAEIPLVLHVGVNEGEV